MVNQSLKYRNYSDQELISEYRKTQDLSFVGELFQRYTHLIFGVCLKYFKNAEESKDATMSIFEKLVDELLKHEVGNFKSWLHVLTRNYCLMKLRSSSFRHRMTETDLNDVEFSLSMHHQDEDLETDLIRLEKCIQELKSGQKRAVELFFIENKCYQEIVDITGFELKSVKSHIQNGKRNLKICLERNSEPIKKP